MENKWNKNNARNKGKPVVLRCLWPFGRLIHLVSHSKYSFNVNRMFWICLYFLS